MLNPRQHVRSLRSARLFAAALTLAVTPSLLAQGPDPEPAPPARATVAAPIAPASSAVPIPLVTADNPAPSTSRSAERKPLGRAASEATPAASPSTSAVSTGISRTTLALAAVLALIFLIAMVVKRLPRHGTLGAALAAAGRAPSGVLEVLGRFTLSRGVTLILLKIDRRVVLISQTGNRSTASISTVLELSDPDEVASILTKCRGDAGESLAARFESTLGRADRTIAAAQPQAPRRTAPTAAPSHHTSATQLSDALRARLAAMRTAAPTTRKAAA